MATNEWWTSGTWETSVNAGEVLQIVIAEGSQTSVAVKADGGLKQPRKFRISVEHIDK